MIWGFMVHNQSLTLGIQEERVECLAAWFKPHVSVHVVGPHEGGGEGVGGRLAARLEGEGGVSVPKGAPLAVDGADTHAPCRGVLAG